jgi:hypothetical protein
MCDFVFSGGGNLFDNNQGQDYHTSVSGGLSLDELEEGIYQKVKASHEKKSAEDDERCYRSNLARALRRLAGISKTLDDNDDDMRMKRVAKFLTVDPPNPKPGHPLVHTLPTGPLLPSMSPQCDLNLPSMVPSCSLHVPSCALHVPLMFP